jgi:hypothetical protein
VNLNSSQARCNLVFGTSEANTDMIRSELDITKLVRLCPNSAGGQLLTQNVLQGRVERRNDQGAYTSEAIPDWLKKQREAKKGSLLWLCMKMNYRFQMKYLVGYKLFWRRFIYLNN